MGIPTEIWLANFLMFTPKTPYALSLVFIACALFSKFLGQFFKKKPVNEFRHGNETDQWIGDDDNGDGYNEKKRENHKGYFLHWPANAAFDFWFAQPGIADVQNHGDNINDEKLHRVIRIDLEHKRECNQYQKSRSDLKTEKDQQQDKCLLYARVSKWSILLAFTVHETTEQFGEKRY